MRGRPFPNVVIERTLRVISILPSFDGTCRISFEFLESVLSEDRSTNGPTVRAVAEDASRTPRSDASCPRPSA